MDVDITVTTQMLLTRWTDVGLKERKEHDRRTEKRDEKNVTNGEADVRKQLKTQPLYGNEFA